MNRSKNVSACSAFTLIELLVVIAIIAILAAMLRLPSPARSIMGSLPELLAPLHPTWCSFKGNILGVTRFALSNMMECNGLHNQSSASVIIDRGDNVTEQLVFASD